MNEKQGNQKDTEVQTFTVPLPLRDNKYEKTITSNIASKPSKQEIINQALNFHLQGNATEAAKYYQYFIDQGFQDYRILSNYGSILKDIGNLQEAELLLRKAIEIKPNYAIAHNNMGLILQNLGKLKEAELSLHKAIELQPDFANAHSNLGNLLRELGNLKEAELSIRKAIELSPNFPEAHTNLGKVLRDIGKLNEAEMSARKAIELNPNFPDGFITLGLILKDIGKLNEAKDYLLKTIEINPNLVEAHYILAWVLLHQSSNKLSMKYFLKTAELLRGQKSQEPNHVRFKIISQAKIQHDIEQFEYLASQGYERKKFSTLALTYKKIASEINWPSETEPINLSQKHQSQIGDIYNRLIHRIEAPKLEQEAVNNSLNVDEISNDYFKHEFGLTYIDNFLSPSAQKSLRKFLLGSTIWFDVKIGGYVGAYMGEGLANPLIIQIAEELRNKFPKIFQGHPINQIWAYKYDSRAKNQSSPLRGINAHADFAAVNVNFWITPKEANLNSKSGGLIVYDVEAPKDWNFNSFNTNQKKIQEELKRSKGNTKIIPYNENRAVIFNSNLFHETDTYEFKEGYENRRINITMLFGHRKR